MNQATKRMCLASLMACGLCVATPAVQAQAGTNVTFYGIVDIGVEHINDVAVNGGSESLTRMSSSNAAASRVGFRGTEDLGGGLKAVFTLETGFAPDVGNLLQAGRLFGRGAFVGLESPWGSLLLGRQRNTIFDLALRYDPLAYATYGFTGLDPNFTARPDNAMKYIFKRGGISATALYSLGRDGLAGTPPGSQSEVAGASRIGRQLGANVDYAAGPLNIAVGFDQQHGTTAALAPETDRRLFIASTYGIAKTRLFAGFQRRDNDIPVVDTKTNLYWVGVKHAITTPLAIAIGLYHTKVQDTQNSTTLLGSSLTYDFSRRTTWYLNAGYAKNGSAGTQGVTSTTRVLAGENQVGVASGLIHRF